MKSTFFTIGTITLFAATLMALPHLQRAEGEEVASTEACRTKVVSELGKVHDVFRAHIFGARRGVVLTGGSVDDPQNITGILETKGRLSSELVEPAVRSYRVFRCRSIAVCAAMQESFPRNGGTALEVKTLGCAPETLMSYGECNLNGEDPAMTSDVPNLVIECGKIVTASLKAERAALKLAFAYDTGYRASLQLGGMIDWMREDAPTKILQPIRSMINVLGKLHEIPCFIGQCDNPDTSNIIPSS